MERKGNKLLSLNRLKLNDSMKIRYIQAIFLFILLCAPLHAQSLDEAKGWYLEGRYAEALPVFQREYQEKPDNAPLNQWVGVCLYETGKILEAKGYLEFASSKKIPEGYLYLGKLLVKLYRFEEAEKGVREVPESSSEKQRSAGTVGTGAGIRRQATTRGEPHRGRTAYRQRGGSQERVPLGIQP